MRYWLIVFMETYFSQTMEIGSLAYTAIKYCDSDVSLSPRYERK